ncbi:MAG: tRNA uridine-5-carboxymethylaminomethyl(34) synthesis GTPase MnmE [Burkholderiales bacterium]|nr:tRNA uridine-5-carboxymethylaminomethyl(34) synthesis GTPase MnmE [Burkholderiales bacterium]
MLPRHQDPIVAIATAPGRGAVGIVRVSGRGLAPLIQALCGRALQPRRAHFGAFLAADGQPIDQGLAIHFPAPHSFTGEDVLELQAHGGPVVLQLLVARCLEAAATLDAEGQPSLAGLRLAGPGEFTERAFLNDKIDLAQAEAVADLIEASTEAAARSAGRSLAGAFSREIDLLRQRIINLRLLVEATLDFPEEEIDFLQRADAHGQLAAILGALDAVLDRAHQGALLREGLQVVLAGQPNVGKSSLLNALAGAELAIVTPIPGTTRDKVSETIQIEGVPLHVIDTAGLREHAHDEVERIGIARSWDAIGEADAVIFLHDLTRRGQPDYEAAEARIAERLQAGAALRLLHVHNKADAVATVTVPAGEIALSARQGEGLAALRQALLQRAGWHASPEGVYIARKRHVQALSRTREHLLAAAAHAQAADTALELFAEELRLAHDALAEITGAFTSDDLLGEIFGRFCIGK